MNLIIMLSDKKVRVIFKGNVDIFGSANKDSFGGLYMKRASVGFTILGCIFSSTCVYLSCLVD